MPQLDKMNWFFILTLLICGLAFFLVFFLKRTFYSWRKVVFLKKVIQFKFNVKNISFLWLLDFFTLFGQFLACRKNLFPALSLKNTTIFVDTVKSFQQNLEKK